VKTNPARFPRAELRKAGGVIEVADCLSVFHRSNVEADMNAFRALLGHLYEFDSGYNTVLMVQVENEVGLLGDSRDGSEVANKRFSEPVPSAFLEYLGHNYDSLHPDLQANLEKYISAHVNESLSTTSTWEEVFGKSKTTDELFMAYCYARYVDRVADAGKQVYPIPLYTNVWLNNAGEDRDPNFPIVAGGGDQPGDYPSGGAVSSVLDIWLHFAPSLDFIAPDIYLVDYIRTCSTYRHKDNPLFIPEQRRDEYGARKIWPAYGNFQALIASPFGIDTVDPKTNPFAKHYSLLRSISQIVLEAQRNPGISAGFAFDELPANWKQGDPDPSKPVDVTFSSWSLTISRCFVFGHPGPGCGMVVHLGGARFLLVGWGFQVGAKSTDPDAKFSGVLKMEEKTAQGRTSGVDELRTVRTLNGDETRSGQFAMMPNEEPDYGGFPIAITIPARTGLAIVEFYSF
jgi:hypothetical protein